MFHFQCFGLLTEQKMSKKAYFQEFSCINGFNNSVRTDKGFLFSCIQVKTKRPCRVLEQIVQYFGNFSNFFSLVPLVTRINTIQAFWFYSGRVCCFVSVFLFRARNLFNLNQKIYSSFTLGCQVIVCHVYNCNQETIDIIAWKIRNSVQCISRKNCVSRLQQINVKT